MLELVYRHRVLLAKCASGAGLSLDEIDQLTELEATFVAGEADLRAAEGRRFRRERVAFPALLRGGALHDSVTIAELTLGGLVCTGAPYAEAGAAIDLTIDDQATCRSYRFKGRIAWVGDDANDDYRLGVELTGAPVVIRRSAPLVHDPVLARLAA